MPPTVERIISIVSRETGVSRELILAPSRSSKDVAHARQLAVFIAWKVMDPISWSALGRYFGRDRTTMRHAVKTILNNPADPVTWRLIDEFSASAV